MTKQRRFQRRVVRDTEIIQSWVAAYQRRDIIPEERWRAAYKIALDKETSPEVFLLLAPLLTHEQAEESEYQWLQPVAQALMNPSCPLAILELGYSSPVRVYVKSVLRNESTPEEWRIEAYLKGYSV